MDVRTFLAAATKRLEAAGIATARLDTLVLLEDTLNTNRARILANPDLLIAPEQQKTLNSLMLRRAQHEPLAYIRNKTEFYGREFYIDHHVLEPRAESEAMIDLLIKHALRTPQTIIDVGTGSGALAITAKLSLPDCKVIAVDINQDCLKVATKNAGLNSASITYTLSDLVEQLTSDTLDGSVLLCNLPYVPDNFQINLAAMREPRIAIFGGADGLDVYRRLFQQLESKHARPALVLTESMPPQHNELKRIAAESSYVLADTIDFIQIFKTAAGRSNL